MIPTNWRFNHIMKHNKYYIHATGGYQGLYNGEKNILRILKSGEIKPIGGKDIFLCDPSKINHSPDGINLKSSFKLFVMWGPSIFLNRNIDTFEPNYANHVNPMNKTTDLYDEVRTFNSINLEKAAFITFPIPNDHFLEKNVFFDPYTNRTFIRNYLKELTIYKEIIEKIKKTYPYIPTKDLYTGKYIDDAELIDARIRILKKGL